MQDLSCVKKDHEASPEINYFSPVECDQVSLCEGLEKAEKASLYRKCFTSFMQALLYIHTLHSLLLILMMT